MKKKTYTAEKYFEDFFNVTEDLAKECNIKSHESLIACMEGYAKIYHKQQLSENKIQRYINAVEIFGTAHLHYVEGRQLEKDIKFMKQKYEDGGGWTQGKKHAFKELFNKIFCKK